MALDSFKGSSMDVGRNFEGTREGPFVEKSSPTSNNIYKSTVDMLVKYWEKVEAASPEQRKITEAIFNGTLDASVRRLNSSGFVVIKSELMRAVKSAYFVQNCNIEMESLEAMGGR